MDFTKTDVCFQPPNRNSFSIKNILNLQGERDVVKFPRLAGEELDDTKFSPLKPIATTVTCAMNPPPWMSYPCAGLVPPLCGFLNWPAAPSGQDIPGWICNTSFLPSHEYFDGFAPYKSFRRRRRFPRKKKQRPLFSQQQVKTMEDEFAKHRYIAESKRAELSTKLGLTETQVKTWFQNRRTKWKKEMKDQLTTAVSQTSKKLQQSLSGTSSSNDKLCSAPAGSSQSHAFADLLHRASFLV